ncbi:hypothetical protein KM043_018679 [Ampulex compressa]|nr:hypothetical protein KM043_018679 [Ampulex compressa]
MNESLIPKPFFGFRYNYARGLIDGVPDKGAGKNVSARETCLFILEEVVDKLHKASQRCTIPVEERPPNARLRLIQPEGRNIGREDERQHLGALLAHSILPELLPDRQCQPGQCPRRGHRQGQLLLRGEALLSEEA